MSNIYTSAEQLIGGTPLLELVHTEEKEGLNAKIYGKLEYLNPAGSVKDRIARAIIADYEAAGKLKPGDTIIEPTSGNTGIGLAAVAAAKGYKLILVMPDSMSVERRKIVAAYGAELVLTEGAKGMKGAIARADELLKEIPGAVLAGQFVNPSNPKAHYETTGPEHRQVPEGKEPRREGRGRGARRFSLHFRRQSRSSQDPGHRRRIRAGYAGPERSG